MSVSRRFRLTLVGAALLLTVGAGSALADDPAPVTSVPVVAVAADDGSDAGAAGPDGTTAPAGQVTVIVRSDAGSAAAAAAVVQAGGTVDATLPLVGGVSADVPVADVAQLARSASVAQVSNDVGLSLTPADGATRGGGRGTVTPAQAAHLVGADAAYAAGLDGTGVDVAVLDTGVVPVPGLADRIVLGPDLSTEGTSPSAGLDGYGHGTTVAGIVAADGPGSFRGIAPGARVVSVKVGAADGSVDVSQVIAGIDWIVQHKDDPGVHIRVLNLSFGTESTQPADLDPLAYAADQAWRHGLVVVTSVGNDGRADRQVADPAIAPSVLAIGAANTHGSSDPGDATVAAFSSLGNRARHADLLAPGVHVLSLRDPGSTLDQAFPAARRGANLFRGSGTSQAAAVVSGAVALLLQQRPDLTPDQVKELLVSTAQTLGDARPAAQGAGLLDLGQALAAATPLTWAHPRALAGTGSLELARGGSHLLRNGMPLAGETTVLGATWDPLATVAATATASTWVGTAWLGASWAGASWAGASWAGASWAGASWAGASWAGASWAGASWAGASWAGASWQGASWQGASWAGASWQGASWQGASWQGASWAGSGG